MSFRKPRVSIVSTMSTDVRPYHGRLSWLLDHDMIVGFGLWGAGTLVIIVLVMVAV